VIGYLQLDVAHFEFPSPDQLGGRGVATRAAQGVKLVDLTLSAAGRTPHGGRYRLQDELRPLGARACRRERPRPFQCLHLRTAQCPYSQRHHVSRRTVRLSAGFVYGLNHRGQQRDFMHQPSLAPTGRSRWIGHRS
jgi:hypothetical protein